MQQDNEKIFCNDSTNHTAGVIHDVNNMLWAICCMADLIKEEIPKNHICQEKVETIAQTALKCTNLLSTSMSAKAESLVKKEEFNLISVIKEVLSFVKSTPLLNIVAFKVNCTKPKVMIRGNRSDISSAFMNLYLNAIEAMPDGGTLSIRTHLEGKKSKSNSTDRSMSKAEDFVVIDIKDTGIGIPPENLSRIFEPHFTTKCSLKKKNFGMGLWRVQQCITRHGGSIHVSSSPGIGTTFSISFPVISPMKKRHSLGSAAESDYMKKKKVVIIDSDETIRDAVTAMLNKVDIDVLAYSNPNSAISWISDHIGDVNKVIIEHNYPFSNGIDYIKRLQAIDPGLRCILCSGTTTQSFHKNNREILLVKPFLKNELFAALNISMNGNDIRDEFN